ncbi:hypothetical protein SMAC4_13781 [Sordaria macrospora]|uniref:uncharacterized protein n=1 Tax=Sordaria macrospora TaxID=5147 RepID=UPI002B297BF4|nr:hypothetical protein SMAC4_13781 [Sordaria macrospora]
MTCRGRFREPSAVTVDMSMIQKATQFDKKRCAPLLYPWRFRRTAEVQGRMRVPVCSVRQLRRRHVRHCGSM